MGQTAHCTIFLFTQILYYNNKFQNHHNNNFINIPNIMNNLYQKISLAINIWLLLLAGTANAQDGFTNAFAFGGGFSSVKKMRYAVNGDLYFVASLGGRNKFAGNDYYGGKVSGSPAPVILYGKVSSNGTQTALKSWTYPHSPGSDFAFDTDGNLFCVAEGTAPTIDYGDGFVETGYGAKLIKVSNTGTVQWIKPINTGANVNYGAAGIPLAACEQIQVSANGDIHILIIANNKVNDSGSPNFDKFPTRIVKFNPSGDEVWHHELASENSGLSGVLPYAPEQFVDNNGNVVFGVTSGGPSIISGGTTLNGNYPYGGYNYWLIALDNTGTRKWYHNDMVLGVGLKAVNPRTGIVYFTYSSAGTTPGTVPYNTLPDYLPASPGLHFTGTLKLDVNNGNMLGYTTTPSIVNVSSMYIRDDDTLIFTNKQTGSSSFSEAGDYLFSGAQTIVAFADANYNVTKAFGMASLNAFAATTTLFAVGNSFKTTITLGGTTLTPFVNDPNFDSDGYSAPIITSKQDAYIAMGTINQIGAPKVTKWTGASSTDWNSASNWTNGVPDAATVAQFDVTATNQPAATTITVGKIRIDAGVTTSLPANLTVKSKLVIDGTLKVAASGFFMGYSSTGMEGSGTLEFTGTSSVSFFYFNAISPTLNLKTSAPFSGSGSFYTLTLVGASAKVTGDININSTDVNAITGTSSTNFIDGKLTRNIASSGTYIFPVGKGSTYAPAAITLNNITGTTTIASSFATTTVTGGPSNLPVPDGKITKVLAGGSWTISPNAPIGSGNYNISLSAPKGSSTAVDFALLKRPEGSTSASDWTVPGDNQTSSILSNAVTATATNINSFSQYIIGEKAVTLPVNLINFVAKAESQSVVLNWETASEQNNKGFALERSADGVNFVKIGEVSSNTPNASRQTLYTFRDKQPLNGNNYYKLVQVDNDGKITKLGIRVVNFGPLTSDIRFYPNPVSTTLNLNGLSGKKGTVNWYNISGQKAGESTIENDKTTVPTHLSNGLYIIKFLLNDGTIINQKVNVYH